jgi:hypothetical protein
VTTSTGITLNVVSARRKNRRGCGRLPVRRDEHVDDLPVLVDGPIHVPPDSIDPHVGFVDEPPPTRRVAGQPGRVGQQRRKPLYPPVHGDVVDLDAALDE